MARLYLFQEWRFKSVPRLHFGDEGMIIHSQCQDLDKVLGEISSLFEACVLVGDLTPLLSWAR